MKFFANLKCNHTRDSFLKYAKSLSDGLNGEDVRIFVPFTAFCNEKFAFKMGAQNFYPCKNGAFTGEIGKEMLDEFDIKSVLIGHSERREYLKESEEFLREKFEFAVKSGWEITYCVGESLEIYESGKTNEFLKSQLKNIDLNYEKLVIAYEPIWAIGIGKSASKDDISKTLDFISDLTKAPLLYGGSVNEKNILDITTIENCSGVLVGSASLISDNFLNLVKNSK